MTESQQGNIEDLIWRDHRGIVVDSRLCKLFPDVDERLLFALVNDNYYDLDDGRDVTLEINWRKVWAEYEKTKGRHDS